MSNSATGVSVPPHARQQTRGAPWRKQRRGKDQPRKRVRVKRFRQQRNEAVQQIFFPRHSKPILDRIDDLLGSIYGFTREEVEYAKAYDGKFRMDED